MTPLPKMYPKDTAPQEVWMSNCRFHYLSSKQTGKFTNLQIPMVGRMETSKYVAGFQGGCFRLSWQNGYDVDLNHFRQLGRLLEAPLSSTLTGFLHPRRQPQESGQELVDSEKPVGCLASPLLGQAAKWPKGSEKIARIWSGGFVTVDVGVTRKFLLNILVVSRRL